MKNVKFLFSIVVLFVLISSVSAFDTSFSFFPVSGTQFKLYCDAPVYLMVNGGSEKFNGFEASIRFDSSNLKINTGTIHPEFKNGNNFILGNLYNLGGAMAGGYKIGSLTGVSFSIITKSNISSTSLYFVDKNGNTPVYGLETTDDGITLNGYDQGSKDILSNVTNVTYKFVALPCYPDVNKPTIENVSVKNGDTKISKNERITFLTYDWYNNRKVSYWFAGNSTGDLSNYVAAPNNVDNQEGVNSGSILVTVSCPSCTGSPNVNANLSITNWDGSGTVNALTWDSQRRGYNVSIIPPFDYEIEKEVTINISVTDNPNETGQTHTSTHVFSFNKPKAPDIIRIYPADTFVSPSKNFPINFYMSDDWAGIDTGSIVVSVSQIVSGEEVLFPGYIYSGSDLFFKLSGGSEGLGNAGSYVVSFYPKQDFPVSSEITIYVTGSDLAGTSRTITSKFTTRPSCDFFGCIDSVNVIGPSIDRIFSGIALVVTGTNPNSPYPYFTGENNDILMCGGSWTGVKFIGNVSIKDTEGNGVGGNLYTNNELFITGLDFVYENGKIIVQ